MTAAAAGVAGYFGDPQRELVVVAGVALLVFVPTLRLPRPSPPPLPCSRAPR